MTYLEGLRPPMLQVRSTGHPDGTITSEAVYPNRLAPDDPTPEQLDRVVDAVVAAANDQDLTDALQEWDDALSVAENGAGWGYYWAVWKRFESRARRNPLVRAQLGIV